MSSRPEIQGWFIPRVMPFGGAPEEIKRQWVDVPLPFRDQRPSEGPEVGVGRNVMRPNELIIMEDSVAIEGVDAVKSLRIFDRDEAAQWWQQYLDGNWASGRLRFAIEVEDQLFPTDYLRLILPGIEDFDQIET